MYQPALKNGYRALDHTAMLWTISIISSAMRTSPCITLNAWKRTRFGFRGSFKHSSVYRIHEFYQLIGFYQHPRAHLLAKSRHPCLSSPCVRAASFYFVLQVLGSSFIGWIRKARKHQGDQPGIDGILPQIVLLCSMITAVRSSLCCTCCYHPIIGV